MFNWLARHGLMRAAGELHNQIKLASSQQTNDFRAMAHGHVSTYDPKTGRARAIIPSFTDGDTDDAGYVLTGWFPLGTIFAGPGYGFQCAPIGGATVQNPTAGEQVQVLFNEREYGVIIGGHLIFSSVNTPPNTQLKPGEIQIQHKTGSNAYFDQGGNITILAKAQTSHLMGEREGATSQPAINLTASHINAGDGGQLYTLVMQTFQSHYNEHVHGGSPPPSPQMVAGDLTTVLKAD